jgi:hypothetical protein
MGALGTNDFFAAGIGFDIAGAYLLAQGLLLEPRLLLRTAQTRVGYNVARIVEGCRDRARAAVGLGALVVGFLLQLFGYLGSIGNLASGSGWQGELLALALVAAAIAGVVLLLAPQLIERETRRLVVEVALENTGGSAVDPVLLSLAAHRLGEERRVGEPLGDALRRVYPLDGLKLAFSGGLEEDRSSVWPAK